MNKKNIYRINHKKLTYKERLIKSNVINLCNNSIIIDHNNNYVEIKPIDITKKVK